ncbi:MAG: hypothetical protein P8J32_08210, partial [bacterium]|nr:hypothetical protein [bacterium]
MAIVIRNDKPKGRFFRYRVNGAPKSVWVDGYSEVVVKELNDTSTMLDKVSRAKAERLERLSNTNNLNKAILQDRTKIFKDVSRTDRWKPEVLRLETGFNTYLFKKEGRSFLFASPPNQSLVIGADIKGSRLNTLSSFYNGVYNFGAFNYTINNSEITGIAAVEGGGTTALTFNNFTVNHTATTQTYTTYTTGSTNVYDVNAQWFSSTGGTGTFWESPSNGFHYSGDSVYIVNVTSGKVDASRIYSVASGPTFSAYTIYNLIGSTSYNAFTAADDNPIAVNTQFYQDDALSSAYPLNTTVKYDVPESSTNRKLTLSNGRVTASSTYVAASPVTINLSGATATTYNAYFESTETVDEVGIYLFSDTDLLSVLNLTGIFIDFTQTPNRFISLSGGRVLAAGDIDWGNGGGAT